ncbi:MAG TPA: NFACT family protein, partial [Planctomycetota bacterium]|nr:NFACT family protein [Planctomycetota bacterium]
MHAIRAELEAAVVGGRVDEVFLIEPRRVGVEVYANAQRHFLVLSLDPSDSRIFLSRQRIRRGTDKTTPFLLLLRKYVRGARIIAIEQTRLERMYTFRLSSRVDHSLPREVRLVAEAMGRRSNLLLIDEDGTIMDALARVPPAVNPARPLLPHLRYSLPPAESKTDPTDPTLRFVLQDASSGWKGSAADLIIRSVAGMSPLAAREALHRAGVNPGSGRENEPSWGRVAECLSEMAAAIDTGAWTPSIAWRDDQSIAFAPYELTHLDGASIEHVNSMSDVVERAANRTVSTPRFDRLKRPMLDALTLRAEQARRKRSSLERSLSSADDAEGLRWAGEAILANAATIEPGASMLEWEGRRVDLYPTLSAAENAQSYFRRYRDARDAKRVVPPLIEETSQELDYLDEMALHVELADSERDLTGLRRELEVREILRSSKPRKDQKRGGTEQKAPRGPYVRIPLDDAEILAGTSALGNETVTFRIAGPD